ncbi:Chromo/chromo shadow domain [Abeliophyllum distichum]|uniref:Chromo/chromo shadow domain n=1 Tax=Abeliophyllum distichum TaxID=126358 RepID=A0ABD1SXD1_9LAMI
MAYTVVVEHLPPFISTDEIKQPEAILHTKIFKKENSAGTHWLIKWKGQPAKEATWEDSARVMKEYQDFQPWGQVLFKGGGCHDQNEQQPSWRRKERRSSRINDNSIG